MVQAAHQRDGDDLALCQRIDFAGQRGVFAKSHAATTGVIVDQELRQNALQMAYCQKTQTKAIRTEMWTCVARTNELG